jgi:hypothetical protein
MKNKFQNPFTKIKKTGKTRLLTHTIIFIFLLFLNLSLVAQDKDEVKSEAKKDNVETREVIQPEANKTSEVVKEEIPNEPKKINTEANVEIQPETKNQAERRIDRRFQIGIFFPATEYVFPKTLNTAFIINKKFSVHFHLSSFRNVRVSYIPVSSNFISRTDSKIDGTYVDFGIRYFPYEPIPIYFGMLTGREFSNESNGNLSYGNYSTSQYLFYGKIEYEPSKFVALPLGFNWQFLNGIFLNINYNWVFHNIRDRHSLYFSNAPIFESVATRYIYDLYYARTDLLQSPITFSIGYAF